MVDLSFFKGKRVLITGHTGFKGAWMCQILKDAGAILTGYALEPPTKPSLFSLAGMDAGMTSVIGDVRDLKRLSQVFCEAQPEIVLHLAAQPIVRASYADPVYTYETNVMGTVNLLECVRTMQDCVRSVVIVTTDKVYQNNEWVWGYREDDPLKGNDPYSNSKSCAELVAYSYKHSFFPDGRISISTVRAGNVIGGGDFAQDRIVPDCVRAAQSNLPVLVRNPTSVRPYQHVLEPVMAYLMLAQRQYGNGQFAGCYNVGPDEQDCVSTSTLVDLFCRTWGNGMTWNQYDNSGPPEAHYLKLDCAKIKVLLDWHPRWHIQQAVEKTVEWNHIWLNGGDIVEAMRRQVMEYLGE